MIRRPRPSVRLRLTLTYTTLFLITGVALLGTSYLLVRRQAGGATTAIHIICTAKPVVVQREGVVSATPTTIDSARCSGVVGAVYFHSSGSGTVPSGEPAGVTQSGGASGSGPTNLSVNPPSPADLSRLAETVKASQTETLNTFRVVSAILFGIFAVVSFGLSWWIAGRALRPVHRITDAARSLSERTLHARINLSGPNDELKQLADTFDAMLGRLEMAFHSQHRFVANASHELRTPLATERVLIDEALANTEASPAELRAILGHLRANSEETQRLIDALLMLARSERGIEQWSPVDLSQTVASVVQQSSDKAAVAGVTISADLEPVVVSGDPGLIESMAGNLVGNALRHNVEGGTVSVATRRELDAAVLEIINTGPVIDPAGVDDLTEPFRRAGPDRSSTDGGTGLGLSIVKAIVGAHGGTLELTARDGGGLIVRVRLAAQPSGNQ